MASETLTLQETADRLGVHYMTVYRWVRTGLLPAVKDHGVWVVRPEDADARAGDSSDADEGGPRKRRRVDHAARLTDRLLAGDEGGAIRLIDDALAGGVSAESLSLEVITEAMRRIGEGWVRGEVSIAQEHQASVIATRLVGRLGSRFTRRGRKRGVIVLGAVAHDYHSLPVALLAGPLRGRGYRVVELGANTPPQAFADAVRTEGDVAAVGISATMAQDDVVAGTIAAVKAADPEVRVVVGGSGVTDEETARSLGADGFGSDALTAIEELAAG